MLVPGAVEDGLVGTTNAVQGPTHPLRHRVSPSGSFTHPEYAQVGLTEAKARETPDVKLVADRTSGRILGCHMVGERAVEIAQLAAIAITAQMRVDELARVAVSFPTYAEVLAYAAVRGAVELGLSLSGQADTWAPDGDVSVRRMRPFAGQSGPPGQGRDHQHVGRRGHPCRPAGSELCADPY